jgi:endogenous inhibitor of DNA gyrase (YacG/DUF329 family)
MKTYGPYTRKDGRQHVVHYSEGKRTTESYPRYLWKQTFGEIPFGYEVDHKDDDLTNNSLDNFQLLLKTENARKSSPKAVTVELTCKRCGNKFQRALSQEKHNRSQGKDGPYCSKRCVGLTFN